MGYRLNCQCQNICLLSLAFILDWRVVVVNYQCFYVSICTMCLLFCVFFLCNNFQNISHSLSRRMGGWLLRIRGHGQERRLDVEAECLEFSHNRQTGPQVPSNRWARRPARCGTRSVGRWHSRHDRIRNGQGSSSPTHKVS